MKPTAGQTSEPPQTNYRIHNNNARNQKRIDPIQAVRVAPEGSAPAGYMRFRLDSSSSSRRRWRV